MTEGRMDAERCRGAAWAWEGRLGELVWLNISHWEIVEWIHLWILEMGLQRSAECIPTWSVKLCSCLRHLSVTLFTWVFPQAGASGCGPLFSAIPWRAGHMDIQPGPCSLCLILDSLIANWLAGTDVPSWVHPEYILMMRMALGNREPLS